MLPTRPRLAAALPGIKAAVLHYVIRLAPHKPRRTGELLSERRGTLTASSAPRLLWPAAPSFTVSQATRSRPQNVKGAGHLEEEPAGGGVTLV